MASKRRGGFAPPELRGTLGTLLRTTTGVVRDALERGAREGRARLDDARANRRRHDALADLGELVLDLIRRGEIDLAELPEARDLIRQLDDLDTSPDDDPPAPPPRGPSTRRRFDDRPTTRFDDRAARRPSGRADDRPSGRADDRPSGRADDRPSGRADDRPSGRADDRPSGRADDRASGRADDRASGRADDRASGRADDRASGRAERAPGPASALAAAVADSDGTVSSGLGDRTMRPTLPARPRYAESNSTRAATKPVKGLWRDRFEDEPEPARAATARGTTVTAPPQNVPAEKLAPRRPATPLDPERRGGISFDDDLEDYMHPDDVPPKPSPPPSDPGDPDDGDA